MRCALRRHGPQVRPEERSDDQCFRFDATIDDDYGVRGAVYLFQKLIANDANT